MAMAIYSCMGGALEQSSKVITRDGVLDNFKMEDSIYGEGGENRVLVLRMDPHFFFFYFITGTYPSCDTYLPCDLM